MTFIARQVFAGPSAVLSWIGRQGTRGVAALVFIGICVPPFGAFCKPFVPAAVFMLMTISFLRLDLGALRSCLKRPGLIIAATAWTALVQPALLGLLFLVFGLKAQAPGLFLGLVLQVIASPMMAAPALAVVMGLDVTLVLVTMITCTAVSPFSSVFLAHIFAGDALSLSPWVMGAKLAIILLGSAALGFSCRGIFGLAAIKRRTEEINGLNLIVLFVIVAALMESFAARFFVAPLLTLVYAAWAFGVFLAMLVTTALVFWVAGREEALAIGFTSSQRNLGLIIAATGALPDLTWFYFALSQFPVYLSPQLLQPAVRRLQASREAIKGNRRAA